jgi:uroporphyrinogen decarboxylase
MTSRERILNAINFKPADKFPVDLGGHRSSGISALAYARLKEYLGIHTGNIYVYDIIQQLAIVEKPVLDLFQADVIELGRGFLPDNSEWKDWTLPDGTPCRIPAFINIEKQGPDWVLLSDDGREIGRQKKGVFYFEQTHYPLVDRNIENDDFSDIEEAFAHSMWNTVAAPGSHLKLDAEGLERLGKGARNLRESTDRAIIGLFGGNLFEVPQFLYGPENYLMAMALYPDKIMELSEKLCGIYLARLEKWLGVTGPYIDIILFGDDFGSNQGPMLSPEMYREFYKPFHRKMWKRVKELADVKIQLHSCGSVEPLLDDLIDAGLDMINPVQISARDMDPVTLKQKYRGSLTFWGGGCDTQRILPFASPGEVFRHVREQLGLWGHEGGYVFQQVHNIMADVPPENIVAMFEAVNGNM